MSQIMTFKLRFMTALSKRTNRKRRYSVDKIHLKHLHADQRSDSVQMRYLGTFETEEEAARAFDHAALRQRGLNIELNLPHEAEAVKRKLAEREESEEDG